MEIAHGSEFTPCDECTQRIQDTKQENLHKLEFCVSCEHNSKTIKDLKELLSFYMATESELLRQLLEITETDYKKGYHPEEKENLLRQLLKRQWEKEGTL